LVPFTPPTLADVTAIDDAERSRADRLIEGVRERRLWHPQWEGPFLQSPEETAAMQAAHGYPIDPMWEVFVAQSVPNSREDTGEDTVVRSTLGFENLAHLLTHDERSLSYELSLAIAAQAAHEALEWLRFDGELVVDPHAPSNAAIDGIVRYLKAAANS
jgi:hypothetical protein